MKPAAGLCVTPLGLAAAALLPSLLLRARLPQRDETAGDRSGHRGEEAGARAGPPGRRGWVSPCAAGAGRRIREVPVDTCRCPRLISGF